MHGKSPIIDYTARGRWNDSAISEYCHEPHLWPFCCCQKVQLWQLLRAIPAGNIVKRSDTSHHSFYFCHCSDQHIFTLTFNLSFFFYVFSHFFHFFLFTHILSVCPISSFSSAAVCPWLHASHLLAQTTVCIFLGVLCWIYNCLLVQYLYGWKLPWILIVVVFLSMLRMIECICMHTYLRVFVHMHTFACVWALCFSLEWH